MQRPIEHLDKLIHFAGGAIVAALVAPFFGGLWALGLAAFFAADKEIYDYFHSNHTPCGLDFIVTVCGGMFSVLCWLSMR